MLSVKAAEDPKAALLALWPRLQSLSAEPVRDETDYVERLAFQYAAFEVQALVRFSGIKPDAVAHGWDQHFVALVRENGRAGNKIEKDNTLEGRIERRRAELFALGSDLVVAPASAKGSRHAPNGLCDDRDSDELEAVQEPFGHRPRECGAPIAKVNRIRADGMVKANHAARPPQRPLPRRMPREKPTWLEAGPGRNWQSATRSA
jgi:hypothetical protein